MAEPFELQPVALDRIMRTRNGQRVAIHADVGSVVAQLREIDDRLHVFYVPDQAFFSVELHTPRADGLVDEHLVGAYESLDGRVVQRIRQITRPGYDLGAELERIDREAQARADHRHSEQTGEIAERVAHAVRKDLGVRSKAFIPRAFRP
jgi:uncharacterized protein (UPF0297 family)